MNALIVLYPGCVFYEVADVISLLSRKHQIIIASEGAKPIKTEEGFVVYSDFSFQDVDVHQMQYIIVPGGDCESIVGNPHLACILEQARGLPGIVIGGICNGALILADAGILASRKCTHTAHPKYAPVPQFQDLLEFANPRFSSAHYIDDDVVVDDRIVTAKPWAHAAFAVEVTKLGGTITASEATSVLANLRGERRKYTL